MNQVVIYNFPFLGEREDWDPFEYLLLDASQEGANIEIHNWMVSRLDLDLGEKINLFIPSLLTPIYKLRNNTSGVVTSVKNEDGKMQSYQVLFNDKINSPSQHKEIALSEQLLLEMLIQLFKDSLILKQGIVIYLKHLSPFFSRIVDYTGKDYTFVKSHIFDDIAKRIESNEKDLNVLYTILKELKNPKEIPVVLDLEELRENIESEISVNLFLVVFAKDESHEQLMKLLKEASYKDKIELKYYYLNYLIAIKKLEKRLYSNYNQIVLIYTKFL